MFKGWLLGAVAFLALDSGGAVWQHGDKLVPHMDQLDGEQLAEKLDGIPCPLPAIPRHAARLRRDHFSIFRPVPSEPAANRFYVSSHPHARDAAAGAGPAGGGCGIWGVRCGIKVDPEPGQM